MITSLDEDIQGLVADIRDGKLLLPELQRGYVWKAPQVRDLFDSLYHQYPSGQLLMWETADIPFSRAASVEGAIDDRRQPMLLLDGQQRLTSLAAIMLGRPLIVRGTQRPIDIAFNLFTEKFEVAGPRQRAEPGWISLARHFTQGPTAIMRDLKLDLSNSESDLIHDRLMLVEKIRTYKYRVNILKSLDYEEVTHIFVRVNSGGTTLGSADLALAQISSRWRGVTQEFETYQKKVAKQDLELDPGLLLRAMAVLLNRPTRLSQLFRGARQDVTVEELQAVWKRVKIAMDQAIAFLVENCKIDRLSLLPTKNVLIPLVAFFDRTGGHVAGDDVRELQRWVYMALIWSRYGATVETRLDQDVAALSTEQPIRGMIRNIEDTVGSRRPVTERELQDQRKNSPYMLMAYVLARYAGAEDWFNGVGLGPNQPLELHHIFPKDLLRDDYDLRVDSRIVDQVANLAFLSKRANSEITNSPPSAYLPSIEQQRLKAQYVPLDMSLWTLDRFEGFLLQRRTMLADAINQLLQSLSDKPALWSISGAATLETRIDAIEHALRDVIDARLTEAWGDSAWERCAPKPVQATVHDRIKQRVQTHPFEAGTYDSLAAKLALAQFSDYPKIIKANWSLFEEVFGKETVLDQHLRAVTDARNAFKHNREQNPTELALAEAGLLWLEDCLRFLRASDDTSVDDELVDDEADEQAVEQVVAETTDPIVERQLAPRAVNLSDFSSFLVELVKSTSQLIPEESSKGFIRFLVPEFDIPALKQARAPARGWLRSKQILVFQIVNWTNELLIDLMVAPGDDDIRQTLIEGAREVGGPFDSVPRLSWQDRVYNQIFVHRVHNHDKTQPMAQEELESLFLEHWDQFLTIELPQIIEGLREPIRKVEAMVQDSSGSDVTASDETT